MICNNNSNRDNPFISICMIIIRAENKLEIRKVILTLKKNCNYGLYQIHTSTENVVEYQC